MFPVYFIDMGNFLKKIFQGLMALSYSKLLVQGIFLDLPMHRYHALVDQGRCLHIGGRHLWPPTGKRQWDP